MRATAGILSCLVAWSVFAAAPDTDWPTLHGNLQRAGFYAHFPRPPWKLVWRKELWRELTGPDLR